MRILSPWWIYCISKQNFKTQINNSTTKQPEQSNEWNTVKEKKNETRNTTRKNKNKNNNNNQTVTQSIQRTLLLIDVRNWNHKMFQTANNNSNTSQCHWKLDDEECVIIFVIFCVTVKTTTSNAHPYDTWMSFGKCVCVCGFKVAKRCDDYNNNNKTTKCKPSNINSLGINVDFMAV